MWAAGVCWEFSAVQQNGSPVEQPIGFGSREGLASGCACARLINCVISCRG